MAEPVLDEQLILHLLSTPVAADAQSIETMQSGVVQALCDLHDRGATREEFIQGAALCLGTYGQTSKLWLLQNIRAIHDDPDTGGLTSEKFDTARDGLTAIIRNQMVQVRDMVTRLMACPGKGDKVH